MKFRTAAMLAIVAAPTFAATPGFARAHGDSTGIAETNSFGPLAPRDGSPATSGFGRLTPDSIIECFGGCDVSRLL
jgi:hypothetical protein